MKRIFCDCCGNEMQYDEAAATVHGCNREVIIGTKVKVKMETAVMIKPVRVEGSNDHIDICTNCKWAAIDKLDPRPKALPLVQLPLVEAESVLGIFKANAYCEVTGGYHIKYKQAVNIVEALYDEIRSRQ